MNSGIEFLTICTIVILIAILIVHSIFIATKRYEYNIFATKRTAFIETLENSRRSMKYQNIALTKDISNWNIQLASKKYHNKVPIIGQYIDDRFETLTPIK